MEIILIIGYTIIFCLVIRYTKFFSFAIPRNFLLLVFVVKIISGLFYTYLHIVKYGGGDALRYFNNANIVYNTLFTHPTHYFYLTFMPNGITVPPVIYGYVDAMNFWGDTGAYTLVRFNSLAHLFSFGNYYVHVVFMSIVSLTGMVFLYKSVTLNEKQFNITKAICIFGIPSVLFWTSGVHKEGLLLFALGGFFYSTMLFTSKASLKNTLALLLSGLLIFAIRDFVLILILPGFLAYLICNYTSFKPIPVFLTVYILLLIAATLIPVMIGHDSFLDMILHKQQQFNASKFTGNTDIVLTDFIPTLKEFIFGIPRAIYTSLIVPLTIKNNSWMQILTVIENGLIILLIPIILIVTRFKKLKFEPLLLWCFLFSITYISLIGFTIPNVGAIVRYRSIALPFLFLFLIGNFKIPTNLSFYKK